MKPVKQTLFGKGIGNCFSTCIACLLELPTEKVPNFCQSSNKNWREETNKWLTQFDLFYMDLALPGDMRDEITNFWGYHIISGDGPRELRHSVIGFAGSIFFDPHPSNDGLIGDDFEYGFLIPTMKKGFNYVRMQNL